MVRSRIFFLAVLFVAFVLTACSPPVQNTLAFERRPGYGSINEVAQLANVDTDDMTLDQTVQFVETWMGAKYVIHQNVDSPPRGSIVTNFLIIPYTQVGIVQYGGVRIILPPRAYPTIPGGDNLDDEVRVVEALCVGPGKIAYRTGFDGQRETTLARQECYLEPAEGWQFDDILSVNNNEMAFRQIAGGGFEFKGPGVYNTELASDWEKITAVFIDQNSFGIYLQADGTLTYVESGWHFDLLPSNLAIYSASQLRYRTLSIGHLANQDAVDDYLMPNSNACQSVLCETIIDRVIISGTERTIDINVEVIFHFIDDPSVAESYRGIGNMASAVQNLIGSPTRDVVRIACASITRQELRTQVGQQECTQLGLAELKVRIGDAPIVVDSFRFRGIDFHDEDLVAAAQAAEVEQQKIEARIEATELELEALEREAELREAQQAQFDYELAQLEAFLRLFASVSGGELNVGELMVLIESGVLPYQFVIGPDGTLVSPDNPDVEIVLPPTPVPTTTP